MNEVLRKISSVGTLPLCGPSGPAPVAHDITSIQVPSALPAPHTGRLKVSLAWTEESNEVDSVQLVHPIRFKVTTHVGETRVGNKPPGILEQDYDTKNNAQQVNWIGALPGDYIVNLYKPPVFCMDRAMECSIAWSVSQTCGVVMMDGWVWDFL